MINYALAQSQAQIAAQGFLANINEAILFPLLTLLTAVALVVFLYGAFEYVKNSSNEQGRETGRRHLIYGVIGMLIMLSAFSILTIAANTFGLQGDLNNSTTNTGAGSGITCPLTNPDGTPRTGPC